MNKWFIKKIKNHNSNYDFRLNSFKNDYSKINFRLTNKFRLLVSLSSYLSKGIVIGPINNLSKDFFRITKNKKGVPLIFDFSLKKSKAYTTYMTLSDNMNEIILYNTNGYFYFDTLTNKETKMYSSLFDFESVYNIKQFIYDNKKAYININTNNKIIITGWIDTQKKPYLIMDLLQHNKQADFLIRSKIYEKGILDFIKKNFNQKKGYCLFIVEFINNFSLIIENIIEISFDEYITYLFDSMLPYKFDLNDKIKNNFPIKKFSNTNIERFAFAIDPDGSKDRDDAIGAFYYNNNKIVNDISNATHIKLLVHISDTLDYIQPNDSNYYYHYSKYKVNTDYLNKYNLPMMDRMLSENNLSLDGSKKSAITTSLLYKIINKEKFIINEVPEKVEIFKSDNLEIIGTTYNKFALSFNLKESNGFSNKNFIERLIIPCNNKIIRDFNKFIYEGKYKNGTKMEQYMANNLKQLYIFFVNSLQHTGKDTLIKIPSTLVIENKNIYLDFKPEDMWAHSLIEYTALETNIYMSFLMTLLNQKKVKLNKGKYIFNYKDIYELINKYGSKIQNQIIDNIINNKKINDKKIGIYRNLFNTETEKYLNKNIQNIIKKLNRKYKKSFDIIDKLLEYYNFDNKKDFMLLIMSLRQMMLLLNSKTNLDITEKLTSKDLKMKAKYEFYPTAHTDVASYFYTHATSPMRRFIDINVHNMIFNIESRDYIFNYLNLDYINKITDIGKQIYFLVNSYRFLEFIKKNNNVIMKVKLIDEKRKSIGFSDIINIFSFESTFDLKKKETLVSLSLDYYYFPILKKNNRIVNKKAFNIFFYMLRRSDKKIQKKIKDFLELIFKVKTIKKIC